MSKPFPVPDPRLPAPVALAPPLPRDLRAAVDQYTATASNFLRNVGYPAVIIGLVLLNFPVIQNIGRQLPEMVSHVQSLEALGMKVAINNTEKFPIAIPQAVPAEKREGVLAAIGKLGPDTFQRFLNVEQAPVSCVFQRPVAMMRKYVALDYELQDIGMLVIADDAIAFGKARREALAAGDIGFPDIGLPLSCYRMDLTPLGLDAKTALVDFFSKAFDARVGLR